MQQTELPANIIEHMLNPLSRSYAHGITNRGEIITQQLSDEPTIWRDHQTMRLNLACDNKEPVESITATIIDMHLQPNPSLRDGFTEHHISIRAYDRETLRTIAEQIWNRVASQEPVQIETLLEGAGQEYQLGQQIVREDLNIPIHELLNLN